MNTQTTHILLIEDNPGDVRLIAELLKDINNFPFELHTEDRLSAGLDYLAKGTTDVVLLDLSLPDSQGFDTFAKTIARAPQTPIVMLTVLADDAMAIKAVQAGAQDYLTKGQISGDLLVRTIRYSIQRKLAEAQILQSEAELKIAQSVAHVGSWRWDIKNNELNWSDEMYRIFGIPKEKFTGVLTDVMAQAIHPEDRPAVEAVNISIIRDKKPIPLEYRVIWPDKSIHWVWAKAGELILDEKGASSVLIGIVLDITERKMREEETHFTGIHDALTKLYNRTFFEEELVRLEKSRLFPVSIFMIDVDELKTINDTHGHAAGDELLQRTAQVLQKSFRPEDLVARIGGDEFVVVLPMTKENAAFLALKRINHFLELNNKNYKNKMKISIGAATCNRKGSLSGTVKKADDLMYLDKRSKS